MPNTPTERDKTPAIQTIESVQIVKVAITHLEGMISDKTQIFERIFEGQEERCHQKPEFPYTIIARKREEFWNFEPKDEAPYVELKTTLYIKARPEG